MKDYHAAAPHEDFKADDLLQMSEAKSSALAVMVLEGTLCTYIWTTKLSEPERTKKLQTAMKKVTPENRPLLHPRILREVAKHTTE